MASTRLSGHALQHEGKPYELFAAAWFRVHTSPEGVALCECGQTSPVLESDAARKRWHREHKAEVLAQAAGMPGEPEDECEGAPDSEEPVIDIGYLSLPAEVQAAIEAGPQEGGE